MFVSLTLRNNKNSTKVTLTLDLNDILTNSAYVDHICNVMSVYLTYLTCNMLHQMINC